MAETAFLTQESMQDRMGNGLQRLLNLADDADIEDAELDVLTAAIADANDLVASQLRDRYDLGGAAFSTPPPSLVATTQTIAIFYIVERFRPNLMTPEVRDGYDGAMRFLRDARDGKFKLADASDAAVSRDDYVSSDRVEMGAGITREATGKVSSASWWGNY